MALSVRVRILCPHCDEPVSLETFTSEVWCRHCTSRISLGIPAWTRLLGGEPQPGRRTTLFQVREVAPGCVACGGAIPLLPGEQTCGCGATLRVRAPDELIHAVLPTARAVIERQLPPWSKRAVRYRADCGHMSETVGDAFEPRCQTCGEIDRVPDPMWRALRIETKSVGFVVVQGPA